MVVDRAARRAARGIPCPALGTRGETTIVRVTHPAVTRSAGIATRQGNGAAVTAIRVATGSWAWRTWRGHLAVSATTGSQIQVKASRPSAAMVHMVVRRPAGQRERG